MPACSGVRSPLRSLQPPGPPQHATMFSQQVTPIRSPSAVRTCPLRDCARGITWSSVRSSSFGLPTFVFGASPQ